MSTRFNGLPSWLTTTLAIAASTVLAIPAYAEPNLTDQDIYPRYYPPTYPEVQTKVLDITSDTNVPSAWIQFDFQDKKMEREINAFRAVTRDMWEQQTLSSDTIRTRDLASPYTTSLSSFSSYYRSTGAEADGAQLDGPIEFQREELTQGNTMVPDRVAPITPRSFPTRPVPALW